MSIEPGRTISIPQMSDLCERCREEVNRCGFRASRIYEDDPRPELVEVWRVSRPVLVLTISVEPADRARAKEAGADEVVSKATGLEEIIATIKRLGTGGTNEGT